MSGIYALIPGIVVLQDAATTGTGGILAPRGLNRNLTIVFQSNGTTSGGTIVLEEAFYYQEPGRAAPVYSGTWSTIQSVSASAFTGTAQQVYHILGASCSAVRARISSDITGGGSVTIYGWGN